jgi:tRNA-dihydrouridine synthase
MRGKIDAILAALRAVITIPFTVKTRLGYNSPEAFADLLELFQKNAVDLVTVHGRTVKDMYGGSVQYGLIAEAVAKLACPVLANGDISTPQQGIDVLSITGARGLMIGRGAVRNPWIFAQIRAVLARRSVRYPTGLEMRDYLIRLLESVRWAGGTEHQHVERMKKYLQFIGPGIEPAGDFLRQVLRVKTVEEFHSVVQRWLNHKEPLPLIPGAGRDTSAASCTAGSRSIAPGAASPERF